MGVPDVWCGPGMGLSTDAASVDCVVSRRPARGKVDGLDRIVLGQREVIICFFGGVEGVSFSVSSLILILFWLLMPFFAQDGIVPLLLCALIFTDVYLWAEFAKVA